MLPPSLCAAHGPSVKSARMQSPAGPPPQIRSSALLPAPTRRLHAHIPHQHAQQPKFEEVIANITFCVCVHALEHVCRSEVRRYGRNAGGRSGVR